MLTNQREHAQQAVAVAVVGVSLLVQRRIGLRGRVVRAVRGSCVAHVQVRTRPPMQRLSTLQFCNPFQAEHAGQNSVKHSCMHYALLYAPTGLQCLNLICFQSTQTLA